MMSEEKGRKMQAPLLRQTVTQQVRVLLDAQGVDLRPWSGVDETYAALYQLLRRRRDDATFWPAVEQLLRGIIDGALASDAATRLPAADAELLDSWDIESLVRDLRHSLPDGEPDDSSSVVRFAAGLQAAAMGGFLILGMAAVGCSHQTTPASPDTGEAQPSTESVRGPTPIEAIAEAVAEQPATPEGTTSSPDAGAEPDDPPPAEGAGDAGSAAPVSDDGAEEFCAQLEGSEVLRRTLADSSLEETAKAQLCDCFASLNESWAGGLTALFERGDAEEIARTLSLITDCCNARPAALRSSYAASNRRFRNGSLCRENRPPPDAVPLYRGVSFPDTQ